MRSPRPRRWPGAWRSEEHTSELQSQSNLVCRLLREKKKESAAVILCPSITIQFIKTAIILVCNASFACAGISSQLKLEMGYFFFNDTATTEIYTLSLHDALPISHARLRFRPRRSTGDDFIALPGNEGDRKSTRLNSSHSQISYAVFCWKKNN